MPFVRTVPDEEAGPDLAAIYQADRDRFGYLPNFSRTFSLRPSVYRAWRGLISSIVEHMEERRFELATLAAARRLRSSYCSLAHGKILREKFYDTTFVSGLATDPAGAGLSPKRRPSWSWPTRSPETPRRSLRQTSTGFELSA